MNKETFKELVKNFHFAELFNELGWNIDSGSFKITLGDDSYTVTSISEKSGFKVLVCKPQKNKPLPGKNDLKKIQAQIKKRFYEHLVIFHDDQKQKQIWQYSFKPLGKPVKTVTTEYYVTQDPQLLYQRASGLVFEIDEEDNITLVDVTERVSKALDQNAEKVTKKFYDGFRRQHNNFIRNITGLDDKDECNWYASVMLNRLMFCYFIQKQGFLDSNRDYLMDKLRESQAKKGRDRFYSFYRDFLLLLFHHGLGSPDREKLSEEFGNIPYLNGGIFSVHELESKYSDDIDITDDAFENLFSFFEEYNWHLDTRPYASGKDINPDVLGYIFEKYINDRAQMGAYYTKEDITGYIGKNTIIPWLFDETQRKHPAPFDPSGEIWIKLKYSGDQYIYPAVKHGIDPKDVWGDLPDDVRAGLDPEQKNLVELRRCWNRPAPETAALPTEIWREVISRRQRYLEVKDLIKKGKLTNINDLITYNLDIQQFAHDLLEETNDPKLVYQFYQALKKITILDPTCGSGAFLFAAMNILEDLYEVCIQWMADFVQDNSQASTRHMKKELALVSHPSHPNLQYFIYKNIILNNLYGVDIMNEAVEIAKLRLFLKLVACVDPDPGKSNYGLEPLPDIDFNIRCGNTLVGYANWEDIENDLTSDAITAAENKDIIKDLCQTVALAFIRYKEVQLEGYGDFPEFSAARRELIDSLANLTDRLDHMLHQHSSSIPYDEWKSTHQPFHWFAEFYEIIHDHEGFDVIIGNPPYVVNRKYRYSTSIFKEECSKYDNIYAFFIDRSLNLLNMSGFTGMIVPISLISLRNYQVPSEGIYKRESWVSSYSNRPGKLFKGVEQRLVIYLTKNVEGISFITKFHHWRESARSSLFDTLQYTKMTKLANSGILLKSGNKICDSIVNKILTSCNNIPSLYGSDYNACWYHDGPTYWIRALPFEPEGNKSEKSNHYHLIESYSKNGSTIIISVLLSTTFYLFYKLISNCRDLGEKEISLFKLPKITNERIDELHKRIDRIHSILKETAKRCSRNYDGNIIEYYEYYPYTAKAEIDIIDSIMAEGYGLDPVEIDYLLNYEIKHRCNI